MPAIPPGSTTAADVMTAGVRTCSIFSTVVEAAMLFRDADCGAVPILEDGKPVGVLTDRDVALALPSYPDLGRRPVSEIMTRGVVSVPPDAPIGAVLAKFGEEAVRRLLVVDAAGTLHGIISWSDLASIESATAVGEVVAETVEPD